jgi:hypothetical protein
VPPTSSQALLRQRFSLIPLLVLLLASGLYLSRIHRVIGYDEAFTLFNYAPSLPNALALYMNPNNHILHSVLVYFSTTLAGHSLLAIRFPAFAAALLSIAFAYRLGRQIGNDRVGLATAGFLATSFWFEDYATQARGYTLSILLTLALIVLLLSKACYRRRYHYALLLLSMALMLVLPSMAVLLVGAVVWILVAKPWWVRITLIMPIVTGMICGGLVYILHIFNGDYKNQLSQFGYSDFGLLVRDWAVAVFPLSIIGGFLAFCLIVGMARTAASGVKLLILVQFTVALILALLQLLVLKSMFFPRNYIYLLPLSLSLGGVGPFHAGTPIHIGDSSLVDGHWLSTFPDHRLSGKCTTARLPYRKKCHSPRSRHCRLSL